MARWQKSRGQRLGRMAVCVLMLGGVNAAWAQGRAMPIGPAETSQPGGIQYAQTASNVRRVQFERGRTTAVLKGTTTGSDTYLLRAKEGQTMLVHVTARGKNVTLDVFAEDGAVLGASDGSDWTGQLPQTGDYRIVVSATKGTAHYTLEVTIR